MRRLLALLCLPALACAAASSGLEAQVSALLRAGRPGQAIQLLRGVLDREPDSPGALYYLVRSCRLAGDKPCAAEAARRLLWQAPDSAYAHKLLGEALDAEYRDSEAEQEFRKAAAQDPGLPEVHFALGMICWRRGELDRAGQEFLAEQRINPAFPRTTFYLADIALRQEHTARAVAYLEESLRLDPAQYDALCELGKAYASLGRDTDAIAQFRKAAALKPGEPAAHYRLSRLLRKAGRIQEAGREQELARANGDSAKFAKTVR
ncbi:MAG TPA: tetratricopeptide repeat protein [Bryobacteraceae bacterium]|nr:tetratricopeptide repeat protein [Bryobacteraceae bacterium]